jgi:carbon storage regulator CsrA
MLVLSRRKSEAIEIGDDVVVRILGVDETGKVKVGIEAPESVLILRSELSAGPHGRRSADEAAHPLGRATGSTAEPAQPREVAARPRAATRR